MTKKKTPKKVKPKPKAAPKPPIHIDEKARMQGLVDGKIEPPSDMVRYFVEQIRSNQKEFFETNKHRQQLQKDLAQAQSRILELKGQFEQTMADLKEWDRRSQS